MSDTFPSIIKEAYYAGQLLQVDDFNREQNFHIQQRNFATRNLFSTGVLSGLDTTSNGSIITVAPGCSLNSSGEYILLSTAKTYLVSESDGDYQLYISYQMLPKDGAQNQLISDPLLKLTNTGVSTENDVLLANITVKDRQVASLKNTSSKVKILSSLLPPPAIQDLDASAIKTGILNKDRIPNLQDLNGRTKAAQLPDLQEMNGQLTIQQLPKDMVGTKCYINFFVDAAVIGEGSTVKFNWDICDAVEKLHLSYFSETGESMIITTDDKVIVLPRGSYSLSLTKTSVFTLSALIKDDIVDQRQLTITVFTLIELVRLQFMNKKSATDCVALVISQLPSQTVLQVAVALAKTGYTYDETGLAIKKSYNITDAKEFGEIMATAFPVEPLSDLFNLVKQLFKENQRAVDCVSQIIKKFPLETAQASAIVMARVGYTFQNTGEAIKIGYHITDSAELGKIMAAAFVVNT